MRQLVIFASASTLLLAALAPEQTARAAEPEPSEGRDSKRRATRAERQLGDVQRPTHERRSEKKSKETRAIRVRLQIPERLRAALERKIELRIVRNVAQATRLRREAIGLLKEFIVESPERSREMPEALLRLGELEWEQARDRFLAAFRKWENLPADVRGSPPMPDYSKSRGRFLRVLRNYKDFRQYDLALYVDGFLATEENKPEEALDRFNRILAWFPKSRFVPDAHMVRAEFEFTRDQPNYAVAYAEYEKVLAYKDSELYDLALFKSAWCLWRMGQVDEAAKRFLTVFKTTAESTKRGARRAELDELQAEALRNLVAVFVEDEKNTADDMHRFLVKAGGEKFAGRIVLALASAFYDQAHYERGIEAYRLLQKLMPMDPRAHEWALSVAEGQSTMELWDDLSAEYRSILRIYTTPPPGAPAGRTSAWVRGQTPETLAKANAAVERRVRQDAVGLHAKAQADKISRGEFEAAATLYKTYLSRFSSEPAAYEIYFNLAEIHFYRLGSPLEAADAYLAAVRMKPRGELSRDALFNALSGLEVAREAEFEVAKKKAEPPRETETDKKLTEAMELYVATYPKDPDVPEMLFRQGKLYYDYSVYDPAVRQWGLLLEKYPKSEHARAAGELILDSFNKSEDYENIETWARRLKTAPAFEAADSQKRLDTLIVQAVFKQGEQLSAEGKHAEAAAAYLRATQEFPKEPRAARAAVNAEIEAKKAADLETLGIAAALLVEHHPGRPETAQGIWIAATTYQSVGLFSRAAEQHALIAEGFPKFEHHKDAAFNAVLLRTTIGEHDAAISSGELYKKHYSRGSDTDEVVFLMGKAHEKAEKWKEAEGLYAAYARSAKLSSSRIEAHVRLATVRVELGNERGAAAALGRAMSTYKVYKKSLNEEGRYFAAKARYMQGERILSEYEKVSIEGDVAKLKTRLRDKSKLLKKAADAFLETAEMGVAEWTTAALYQVGFTYESFAKALLESPPPEGLTPEQQGAYQMQIDEFVIPIEERSIEAYESGWYKAVELGIFNEWTAKMREALGRLTTELYPPLNEIGFELRSRAPRPMPALIEGPRRTKAGRSIPFIISEFTAKEAEAKDASESEDGDEKGAPSKASSGDPAKAGASSQESVKKKAEAR